MSKEKTLTNLEVATIASEWYSSGRSPLYALSSSGTIVDGVENEIEDAIKLINSEFNPESKRLTALLAYVKKRKSENNIGPQKSWKDLHW